jgi:ATP-dependent RNA helicase RhlE
LNENSFAALGLAEPLMRALSAASFTTPTPIQAQAIPPLVSGRDMIGLAQTGTGKTAAFALPMLQRLSQHNARPIARMPRALVLAPTRELALQIADSTRTLGRFTRQRVAVVMGGVGIGGQAKVLAQGVDILIATPGRLLDLMEQGQVRLDRVEYFVLDEADRMLDMGFIRDIRKIVAALPRARQSALFSATMPGEIAGLAKDLLKDSVQVSVTPKQVTVDRIDQRVYFVDTASKRTLLMDLLKAADMERVIVFTRTKHGADRVATHLAKGGVKASAIHGNKSQGQRQRALGAFKSGQARVLVATDIAARGIDVADVTHVVNFDLPMEPEAYVHRIGRTARNGAAGIALTFCDHSERGQLRAIERLTKAPLAVALGERGGERGGEREGERPPASDTGRPQQRHGRQRHSQPKRQGQPHQQAHAPRQGEQQRDGQEQHGKGLHHTRRYRPRRAA